MQKQSKTWRQLRLIVMSCMLSCFCITSWAQNQKVMGQVVDSSSGEPLIGVSVTAKGAKTGAVTDANGNYTVEVPAKSTLVFSYVGYTAQEVGVATANGRAVRLVEDDKVLNEVVVVGYGTQKKVNLSGAVTSVDGEALAAKPATDVLSAMQGEMPGVQVLRSSGQPGSETSGIRVRGFSSANSTSALVLIDGVEGDLTLLNPNDIESISVLKDASACAIYGARAAAGVILVTTKASKTGKAKVAYNGYFGVNLPGIQPKRLPAWEEQVWINEGRMNADGKVEWSAEQSSWVSNPNFNYRPNNTNGRWDFFQATNWVDEGTNDYTTQQSHSLSVTGGTKQLNYLLSGNFYTKSGILRYGPDKNDRYTLRAKINSEVSKYVDLNFQFNMENKIVEQNPYGPTNILGRLYRVRGRQPILNPAEAINENPYNGDLQVNAIDLMKNGGIDRNQYNAYTVQGGLTIKNLVKGLRLNVNASRRAGYYTDQNEKRYLVWNDRNDDKKRFDANNPNSLKKQKNNSAQDKLEALLTYDWSLKGHTVHVLAGTSYEQYRLDEITATVKKLNSNDFFSFNYYDASDAANTALSDNIGEWKMMSYFGRINYNYKERYLLEGNIRYDGSSRLAPGRRWKAFPSFSAAWRISEEPWFNVDAISNLKLRASWGQLGNGAIMGLYDYLATIQSGTNQGVKNYYQDKMASESKTWEVITSKNIGIDLALFNNHFNLSADYYWKTNDNMLANLELPSIVGIGVPQSNVGTLKTWGWEVEASYRNSWNDLHYKVSFNIGDSNNEVTHYDGANSVSAGTVGILEGYPLNSIWGYRTDGFWSSRDEYLEYKAAHPGYQSFNDAKVNGGDVKYLAQGEPDHTIGAGNGKAGDSGDLVYLGTTNSRYMYSFGLNLDWRGFDFSVMFQGVGKRTVYIEPGQMAPFATTSEMPWTIHRDYWTPENTEAYWPRLYNYNGNQFNFQCNDRYLQDASYLRLKNIQLGYTFALKKYHIDKLRVYVSGQDLWETTNMLGVYDPEVGNKPGSTYYPFFRTMSVGVNLVF